MKTSLGLIATAVLLSAGATVFAEDKVVEAYDILSACHSDVEDLCKGNIVGGEGLKACMKSNLTMLSDPCFKALMTIETAGMPQPPDYGATAKRMRFDNLRGTQYCEFNLIYADIENATLYTEMWNSTDLNNAADPKNFCPDDLWAKVDADKLAKENKTFAAWKNGPRGWTMDWIDLPVGDVTTFDGWQGRWMARPTLPKGMNINVKGSSAYKPLIVDRKSIITFNKGTEVFILDGPNGAPWVMQAWGKIVDPTLEYDDLAKLGDKLKPAEGWKFRTAVLDQELKIVAVEGKAHLVQDELENSYDGCTPGACSFQP